MAADYTSSKYSATSATLWACRCCVSVCVWMFALCVPVCVSVCMSSCLSLLLRHLCSMLIVRSFCCVYTLTPAYIYTHTQTNTPVDRLTNMLALQRLSKLWQEQMNMEITSVIQFDSHCTRTHSMRYMNVCQSKLKASSSDWQRIRHSSSPNIDAITHTHTHS